MKKNEFMNFSTDELKNKLIELLKEQFSIRMQNGMKQLKKVHLFKKVRRDISRVKTILTERGKSQ
jgi:large subunit ribosomal protein L29